MTIPVKSVAGTHVNARVCFKLNSSREAVHILGSPTKPAVAARSGNGEPLPGRLKIEYLSSGHRSWWAVAPEVARRMGLDRAPSGTWVVLPLILLMGGLVATASWLLVRELR